MEKQRKRRLLEEAREAYGTFGMSALEKYVAEHDGPDDEQLYLHNVLMKIAEINKIPNNILWEWGFDESLIEELVELSDEAIPTQ